MTPWIAAHQAPLSMDFSRFPRQEYWSGLSFLSPGDLPYPGIDPDTWVSCITVRFFTIWSTPIEWTWTWANSKSWWGTRRPGMLQSKGSQSQTQLSEWTTTNMSGLPFPSPGDLPNPGIEPRSPALQVNYLPAEPPGKLPVTWDEPIIQLYYLA